MAKEAILQVRMDADVRDRVDLLYRRLGTTFAEAVRMFASQSLVENGLPFKVTTHKTQSYEIPIEHTYAGYLEK